MIQHCDILRFSCIKNTNEMQEYLFPYPNIELVQWVYDEHFIWIKFELMKPFSEGILAQKVSNPRPLDTEKDIPLQVPVNSHPANDANWQHR